MEKHLMLKVKTPITSEGERGWNKLTIQVDTSKRDSGALEGRFLDEQRTPLLIGSLIVSSIPWKAGHQSSRYWSAGIVTSDGMEWLPHVWDDSDFASFRDHLATLLPKASQMDASALRQEREQLQARIDEVEDLLAEAEDPWL